MPLVDMEGALRTLDTPYTFGFGICGAIGSVAARIARPLTDRRAERELDRLFASGALWRLALLSNKPGERELCFDLLEDVVYVRERSGPLPAMGLAVSGSLPEMSFEQIVRGAERWRRTHGHAELDKDECRTDGVVWTIVGQEPAAPR